MTTPPALASWHLLVRTRDPSGLDALLADDAVFHSPVVHTPQCGKALTRRYLEAAFSVLFNDSFRYLREVVDAPHAVLEFHVELDGIVVNGIDMIHWNDADRIDDFKVMLRPLKGIQRVHERMAAQLQASR